MNSHPLSELRRVLAGLRPFQETGRELHARVGTLVAALARHEALGPDGPLLVLLFGGANTGKSTLFNAFVGRDVSPAQAISGATRHAVASVPATLFERLHDPALWPPAHPVMDLPRREALLEELSPRRLFLDGRESTARGASSIDGLILLDSPDVTTSIEENAVLASSLLVVADVVILVLTSEQHADQALVEHFALLRQLGKRVLAVFNRCDPQRLEDSGPFQKFRLVWMENQMGDLPARFGLRRVDAETSSEAGRILSESPELDRLRSALGGLDRRDLLAQTRTGLTVALAQRGAQLVAALDAERAKVALAAAELRRLYDSFVTAYNEKRRWASRMLQMRSWLQSTMGSWTASASPGSSASSGSPPAVVEPREAAGLRFWRAFVTPLSGQPTRPSALEGLEIVAETLEEDPHPAPLFRPLSRLFSGLGQLVYGKPRGGEEASPVLNDALELLERERCRFILHEVLPRTLGADWAGAVGQDVPQRPPALTTEEVAEVAAEYGALVASLRARVRGLMSADPGVRSRIAGRHAGLAVTAAVSLALAAVDLGYTSLLFGAGLAAPVLWELMDWAATRPELEEALGAYASAKAQWLERTYHRVVTFGLHGKLREREAALETDELRRWLQAR